METGHLKEVYFGEYCRRCIHFPKKENEDPCYDCLEIEARVASHKPEYFEPKAES